MTITKKFGAGLSEVHSSRPAVARILIERGVSGDVHITSTMDEESSINALDEAMEAIDGKRLPPDAE